MEEGKRRKNPSNSFTTGAIALVFLIIGFEIALFVHKAAVTRLVADRDRPDTVYMVERVRPQAPTEPETAESETDTLFVRKTSEHAPEAVRIREKAAPRRVETFRFDPNTVSPEDLMRLGFSEKQAQSIVNYRKKGGRFHRPSDFAKSYVVADSVYERLAPFIDIPRIDLNRADSAAFETLPGIGPYFACSPPEPYPLWTLSEAELARHPHVSKNEAHSIVLYRTHQPPETWTLEGLHKAGVLSEEHYAKLSRCVLAGPK